MSSSNEVFWQSFIFEDTTLKRNDNVLVLIFSVNVLFIVFTTFLLYIFIIIPKNINSVGINKIIIDAAVLHNGQNG